MVVREEKEEDKPQHREEKTGVDKRRRRIKDQKENWDEQG